MTTTRTIIGDIGDTVILTHEVEAMSLGLRAGQKGEIVGFELTAYGRTDNFGIPPGIYRNPAYPIVKVGDMAPETLGRHLLASEPGREGRTVERSDLKVADLPRSDFYEMDTVTVPDGGTAVVRRVDYLAFRSGGGAHAKAFSCDLASGGTADFDVNEIALVSRGNVWRREHGEKLVFGTSGEEGDFYRAVGECDEVRSPTSGNFAWSRDDAVDALVAGEVHGFHDGDVPASKTGIHMIRFRDEAVGETVRHDTLQRLGVAAPGMAP